MGPIGFPKSDWKSQTGLRILMAALVNKAVFKDVEEGLLSEHFGSRIIFLLSIQTSKFVAKHRSSSRIFSVPQ
jgi:hypothetical protein